MKTRQFISLITVLILLFSFCGCRNEQPNTQSPDNIQSGEQADYSINLLYCSNDTYNPYTLTTKVNSELCQLLYDPLVNLDNSFEPVFVLAATALKSEKVWHITLKDAVFTDGIPLNASDVIYSFNLAKHSAAYSSALSKVINVTGEGKNVYFELSVHDPYFVNVLSFPIIKEGSDNIKNEDDVIFPPIGTGRFYLNEDQTGLIRNDNYFGEKSKVSNIKLINAPDKESVSHYVEVGATDYYYADTLDGNIYRMSGKKSTVNQNNLVYVGINLNDSFMSNIYLRYAISAAIDREKIALSAFFGNALAATGPFNPSWKQAVSYQTAETSAKKEIAIENLEKIGYNSVDNAGYRVNASGYQLVLNLVVNSENATRVSAANMIASQLKEVGIKVNISLLNYADYLNVLKSGSFQMYLGEIELDGNFDLSNMLISGGSCAFGLKNADSSTEEAVNISDLILRYQAGEVAVSDVITAVQSEMPFIPVCYRTGILFYSNSISDLTLYSADDLFCDISKFTIQNQ